MSKERKSTGRRRLIQVFEHEDRYLKELYLDYRIHLEHYELRPNDLHDLCEEWRAHCGRSDSDGEIFRYMRAQRKLSRWVRAGDGWDEKPNRPVLSAEEVEVLVDIYHEHVASLGIGSDNLAYEPDVAELISKEFEDRTSRRIPAPFLVGILTELRKRGRLPPIEKPAEEEGFDDIGEVM